MQSDGSRNTRWFVLALLGTMVTCLICIVSGYLVFRSVVDISERAVEVLRTTDETEPTLTAVISPSDETQDLRLPLQTLAILEQTIVPINNAIELAERLRGLADIPPILATSATPIEVGAIESFWVSNQDTIENFEIDAEMVYASPHVYFWIEEGVEYDLTDVQALVDDFEKHAYPTNRAFFGSEWTPGIDGDEHLYMLYARNLGSSVAGYFSSADTLPPAAHQYSNSHEMFYINADTVGLWEDYTYGVLAHEFQHMIHWNLDRNEDVWISEGLAEIAVHLNDFSIGGMDWVFSDDPDLPLTYWPADDAAGHYGQSFLFLQYFLDRFGSEATKLIVSNPNNGLASIDQTLASLDLRDTQNGSMLTADDIHRDWTITLLVGDESVDDGRYAYQSYNPPAVDIIDTVFDCQNGTGTQKRQVHQYGVDYIQFRCGGNFRLEFDGAVTVPVLPGEPHSGEFSFWSNRGDESDMTLTRAFDLREVEASDIALTYWVWYDIEEGWDYLYLEVSTDDGDTWKILETPSGTDRDLSGNSYGWGYTGFSGGGDDPVWIEERVDLSAYAGEEILLRFEYITDTAVNGDGLLLDDIHIDALGYYDDFEEDDGEWQARGFVRLYNRLPQRYSVVLVEQGDETRVREVELDESNRGSIEVELGGTYEQATLIVSGTTRYTWQPAAYTYEISP